MKRLFMGACLAVVVALGILLPVQASVNDFTISKFEADYYLAADAEGRSTLKIVERITADFPDIDQNHGIERAIPTRYDNHPTHLKIESVTDETGKELPYSTRSSNDNEILRIGEADTYVHGYKTYVITYTQRDVTRYFKDTDRQEFYWDINGTEWQQAFGQVTARIHLSPSIAATFTKDMACYQGRAGSADKCDIKVEGDTIVVSGSHLSAGASNMTVALGFTSGTFREYEPSLGEKIFEVIKGVWMATLVASSLIGFILIFVFAYRSGGLNNRNKDLGTIIPEYLPPKNASILVSAQVADGARGEMVAQIIDLAVRHYLKMYQVKEKSLFKSAEYELEIIKSITDLKQEEKTFLATLFGSKGTMVGARFEMKSLKNNYSIASTFYKNRQAIEKSIKGKYGLRRKDEAASRWFKRAGTIALIASIFTLSPMLLIASIVAYVCGSQLRPLTDEGLALRRYLAGLKLYIGMAEQERFKALQSPEGAEKVGVVGDDTKKLVKLYEKVLPYAVLFGQEREWNKQLGMYYESSGASPDWYSGQAAFNAAVFTSALNDFSSTTSTYSAATSSSSGGLSGGGSSGGGGGGGGGGGW